MTREEELRKKFYDYYATEENSRGKLRYSEVADFWLSEREKERQELREKVEGMKKERVNGKANNFRNMRRRNYNLALEDIKILLK